jgi:hypothetical protein
MFTAMTRRSTRIAWALTGVFLIIGAGASILALIGPPDRPWNHVLTELSAFADILAILFWMLIFAIYWTRRSDGDDSGKTP